MRAGDLVADVGLDPKAVALAHHWFMKPYRFIEWLGPVATPALLIAIAILLLALNFVAAALTVAAVAWMGLLYTFFASNDWSFGSLPIKVSTMTDNDGTPS